MDWSTQGTDLTASLNPATSSTIDERSTNATKADNYGKFV